METIFTAWYSNVGDREMIDMEFGKNMTDDKGNFPLDSITQAAVGFFPSIKAYILDKKSDIQNKHKVKKQIAK